MKQTKKKHILLFRNPKPFDWYQNYDGIKDILTQFLKKESKILVVGCGNSRMNMILNSKK